MASYVEQFEFLAQFHHDLLFLTFLNCCDSHLQSVQQRVHLREEKKKIIIYCHLNCDEKQLTYK